MDLKTLIFFSRKTKQNGTISIEFVAAVPILIILILFFLEMCRMISLCAAIDLALAESGRYTARASVNDRHYKQQFIRDLQKRNQSLFNYFLPSAYEGDKSIDVNVTYCASLQDIINNNCNDNSTLKLAIYNINYNYKPLFLSLPKSIKNKISFHRKIVYIQELSR